MNKLTGILFLDGIFRTGTITLENGVIAEIDLHSAEGELPYICPGLIDVHTHGLKRNNAMGGCRQVRAMSEILATHGITSFLPTTVTSAPEDIHAALLGIGEAMREVSEEPRADILGAHIEGPFINPKNKGAHDENLIKLPKGELYDSMTEGFNAVKIMTIAPEMDGARELIERLSQSGVVLSCGHSAATADLFHESVSAGISHVTHLFNAMSPLHHREPGVAGAALYDPRVTVELIADGIHLHPTVLKLAAAIKPDKCVLITDAMEAADLGEGEYTLGKLGVIVKDGAARLPTGVLAGSILTLDRAVRNMISWDIAPANVIKMATSTPAKLLNLTDRGRIARGLRADIAVFGKDWRIEKTYIKGRPVKI